MKETPLPAGYNLSQRHSRRFHNEARNKRDERRTGLRFLLTVHQLTHTHTPIFFVFCARECL